MFSCRLALTSELSAVSRTGCVHAPLDYSPNRSSSMPKLSFLCPTDLSTSRPDRLASCQICLFVFKCVTHFVTTLTSILYLTVHTWVMKNMSQSATCVYLYWETGFKEAQEVKYFKIQLTARSRGTCKSAYTRSWSKYVGFYVPTWVTYLFSGNRYITYRVTLSKARVASSMRAQHYHFS